MLISYFIIAVLAFIVLGLISELTIKSYEETDWYMLALATFAWPASLVVLTLMTLACVIIWVAKTIKGISS